MSDKRIFPRIRSLLGARIEFNNRSSTMDCLVREMSKGGAKLEFSDARSIPDTFDVVVPSKGQHFRAEVRWRHGNSIGVEFTAPEASGRSRPPAARDLEAENALLRRKLASIQAGSKLDD